MPSILTHLGLIRFLAVAIGALLSFVSQPVRAQDFGRDENLDITQTLVSASRNLRVVYWNVSNRSHPDISDGDWNIEKSRLVGGKQEGVDIVKIHNGEMEITVVPTRGMSILEVKLDDWRAGWDSPVKEVVHPSFIDLESRGGLGWLEGFNEWMTRCGLEFAGHPGEDSFINNVGDEVSMPLTLHGRIGNIPASEVILYVEREPRPRIRLRGRVDERAFYGAQLELWTELIVEIGANTFTIRDEVTNMGASEQEFQLIYHTNFGEPLLEDGARFVAPIEKVAPMNEHAAQAIDAFSVYPEPTPGFIEEVFLIWPYADPQNRTRVALVDRNSERAVSMEWSLDQLPYLTQWRNTPAVEAGYVTGIEPGTGFPYNRKVERGFGRVPKLGKGETAEFEVRFGFWEGANQVEAIVGAVESIQGDRATTELPVPTW